MSNLNNTLEPVSYYFTDRERTITGRVIISVLDTHYFVLQQA